MSTTTVELDAQAVGAWLERYEPNAVVGIAGTYTRCPLATYLREVYGASMVAVGHGTYQIDDELWPLPDWAERFVDLVDSAADDEEDDEVPVRAGLARDLLASLVDVEDAL